MQAYKEPERTEQISTAYRSYSFADFNKRYIKEAHYFYYTVRMKLTSVEKVRSD